VVGVRPDAGPEVVPALVLLAQIDRPGPRRHLTVIRRQALDRPVRRAVLGADFARLHREPDPRERQHGVARVVHEAGHHLVDAVEHGAGQVLGRDGIEQLGRRRPKQRPARPEHHREEQGDVGVRGRRQRLDVATLERRAVPLAELKVETRRVPPGLHVGLGHDRHLHRPVPVARDREQSFGESALLLGRRRPVREDQDIEVAPGTQPAHQCRAVQVRAEHGVREDIADQADDRAELILLLGRRN